jgi:hypothetical protein
MRTAHTLNSGILLTGSIRSVVSRSGSGLATVTIGNRGETPACSMGDLREPFVVR